MNVGEWVDITKLRGVCVYCEKVIFVPGEAAVGVKNNVTRHLQECPKSPYRGIKPIKYADDPRLEAFNGTADKD